MGSHRIRAVHAMAYLCLLEFCTGTHTRWQWPVPTWDQNGPHTEPLRMGSHMPGSTPLHTGTRYMAHIGMAMHPLALLRYLELDPNGRAAQVA